MGESVKIGVLHAKIRMGAKRGNTRRLYTLIQGIMQKFSLDLLVLPAYAFTGPVIEYYPTNRIRHYLSAFAERMGRNIVSTSILLYPMRWAREFGVNILVGPMIERAGPRLYVTALLIDYDGAIVAKYRKIGVTRKEEQYGINRGKEPGVFPIPGTSGKIGVFADDDLAYPEVFRILQESGVNILLGFMLPYPSDVFRYEKSDAYITTMDSKFVKYFLSVRSRETGLPGILVGGIVEDMGNHGIQAYMPTMPFEPDIGVIEDRIKRLEDPDSHIVIDIDLKASRPSEILPSCRTIIKNLCKRIK